MKSNFERSQSEVRRRSETAVNAPLGVRVEGLLVRTLPARPQAVDVSDNMIALLTEAPDLFARARANGSIAITGRPATTNQLCGNEKGTR